MSAARHPPGITPDTSPAADPGATPPAPREPASLSRVVFRGILAACLLVVGLWEAFSVYREANSRRAALLEAGDLRSRRLANTLANPLWNFDHDEVHRAVLYEASSPGVLAILVEDDKGRLLVGLAHEAPGELGPYDPAQDGGLSLQRSIAAFRQPVSKGDRTLGTVAVHLDGKHLGAVVLRTLAVRSGEFVFLVTALLGVFFLVLRRNFLQPIAALDRHIAGVTPDLPMVVPVVGAGEIRRLGESFNAMAAKLGASFAEQGRLLAELRRQQGLFTSLEANLPGVLFRAAPPPGRELRHLSGNFSAITGYPRERFLGEGAGCLNDIVLEDDRAPLEAAIRGALTPGARYDVLYRIREAGGVERWMHETGRSLRDEDGATVFDAIAIDVTEERLREDQLRQAQKMETVGMLAGGLAHDFNNILTVIVGATSLARFRLERAGSLAATDVERTVATVEEAAFRAKALVDQLLALSRPKALTTVPVDLTLAVRHVTRLLASSFDKSIRVALDGPSEPAVTLADPAQLEQAVLNLCVNAAHAMTFMRPPGEPWGGTLSLALRRVRPDAAFRELHPEAGERGYWALAVHDTGVGMDRATRARLFTPFFTTKDTGQGTGLGLPMVYSIVKGAGGFLSVYSEPGAGSTFTLFLPEVAAESAKPGGAAAGDGILRGSGTVLVVDDEENVRRLAAKILEECGYTVLTAADGAEGVKLFGALAGGVDLVLLDLMMPVLSGREAFQRMRELRPAVRVLLSSGFRHDARVHELLNAGVVGFVEKPFTFQSLSRAVGEALGGSATTGSA